MDTVREHKEQITSEYVIPFFIILTSFLCSCYIFNTCRKIRVIKPEEHFRELLEGEPTNNIELEYRNEELVELPSVDEVKISIEKLRNHKSPGSDDIPAELFKHGGEQLTKVMREIVCRIWSEDQILEELSLGFICPLYKKGYQLECNKYRGITLLNTAYKILSNILHKRLKPYTEMFLGESGRIQAWTFNH
ncbi:unnamed protein product [Diabrotica balteata]|uniref:Uncharacterized protein n=1 Tax=Diabrotica balteata TaxID=107213 RepID=A0A9N9XBT7_DIABA|nr:unnamed protein product [Diabrotica balteata]